MSLATSASSGDASGNDPSSRARGGVLEEPSVESFLPTLSAPCQPKINEPLDLQGAPAEFAGNTKNTRAARRSYFLITGGLVPRRQVMIERSR